MTLSDVLSLLAIGVSIYAVVNTNSVSKHIANKTLQKEYFDKIFFDFMLKTFPQEIMEKIEIETDSDVACDEIEKNIVTFLKEAKVYKYINQDFYSNLYAEISKLEDLIFTFFNEKAEQNMSRARYDELLYQIDSNANELYVLLKKSMNAKIISRRFLREVSCVRYFFFSL